MAHTPTPLFLNRTVSSTTCLTLSASTLANNIGTYLRSHYVMSHDGQEIATMLRSGQLSPLHSRPIYETK